MSKSYSVPRPLSAGRLWLPGFPWSTYFIGFMLPTLIGNIIGGVSLVAALNFAQVASEVTGSS